MRRQRPDLIVPIRDRRQSKRYLTLRNAFGAFIAMLVIFAGITIRSEMEPENRATFGDLFSRELPELERKPMEIVREAPQAISDHTAPDPMLVAPMAREQWLVDSATNTEPIATAIEPVAAVAPRGAEARIAIVGGPEGVSVVEQKQRRPKLTGGFGR